jgi:hypothetical protein
MKRTISGPGASDFLAAGGGEDLPESGGKGTAQLREESEITSPRNLVPQLAPENENDAAVADPQSGKRRDQQDEELHGSQTGNIGGGGPNSDRPNPART